MVKESILSFLELAGGNWLALIIYSLNESMNHGIKKEYRNHLISM
ncbi:hypothetical protein D929_00027 [Enterococcus faecalis 02-MB-P-10]|nr:hypothetical protein D929_00027 [Enterococcus faecalis 02-MB-P-10]